MPTQIIDLLADQVLPNPDNARDATRGIASLAASIKEVGVLVPLIVVATPDSYGTSPDGSSRMYVAVDGSRRVNAARTLGDVGAILPCIVADNLDDAKEQVKVMAVTALARDGLTAKETAQIVQTMLDYGMSQAAVGRTVGMAAKQVKEAKQAAKAVSLTDGYDLTLDQLAAIGEFADDSEAIEVLVEAAKGNRDGGFDHALSRLRRAAKAAKALDKAAQSWIELGYQVLTDDEPVRRSKAGMAIRLDALIAEDGVDGEPNEAMGNDEHAECPGRAVFLWQNWNGDIHGIECCTQAMEHHKLLHPEDSQATDPIPASPEAVKAAEEAKAAATEERRALLRNNREMLAATDVRRAFVTAILGNKRKAKEVSAWALRRVVEKDLAYVVWVNKLHGTDELTQQLTGGKTLTDPVLLWSQVCTAYEAFWTKDCWRLPGSALTGPADYLRHLVDLGYPPADVELLVVAAADAYLAQRPPTTIVDVELPAADEPAGVVVENTIEGIEGDEDGWG